MNGNSDFSHTSLSSSILNEYKKFAPYYHDVGIARGHFSLQTKFLLDILKFYKNCTVLDAACASGDVLNNLGGICASFTLFGTDGCSEFITQAEITSKHRNIIFSCVNWNDLPQHFEEESFDFIIILGNSIGHVSSINEFYSLLTNIYRLLKKGGNFIFDLRPWIFDKKNINFNEPNGNSNILYLSNNARYETSYLYKNQRHCLTHQIYDRNGILQDTILLSFLDFSKVNLEHIFGESNFSIEKKYYDPGNYPFLTYHLRK